MDQTDRQVIEEFVKLLKQSQPPRVEISIPYYEPGPSGARGVITGLAVVPSQDEQPFTPKLPDYIYLGDVFDIVVASRQTGYMNIYNLGASGTCALICNGLHVRAGQPLDVASKLVVNGETTDVTGHLDRLLAVVVEDSKAAAELNLEKLYYRFQRIPSLEPQAKGAAGSGQVRPRFRVVSPSNDQNGMLLLRPTSSWSWGIVELTTRKMR